MAGDYIDKAALITRFTLDTIRALSDPEDTGEPVDEIIDAAIECAESLVNSYVTKVYTLESVIDAQPPIVISISLDMALYELAKGKSQSFVIDGSDYDTIYQRNLAILKAISKGETTLGIDDSEVVTQVRTSVTSNTRVFNDTTLEDY